MRALIRAAARLLPMHQRAAREEAWMHDAANARELGIAPSAVASGAISSALLTDRTHAPTAADAALTERWRARSAWAWLVAALLSATALSGTLMSGLLDRSWITIVLVVVALAWMLALGCTQLGLAARADPRRETSAWLVGIGAVMGVLVLLAVTGLALIVAAPIGVALPVAAAVLGVVLLVTRASRDGRRHAGLGLVALLTALAGLALGVLDGLVLLPLALAPGRTFEQLDVELAAAGESIDGARVVIVVWGVAWAVASVLMALAAFRRRWDARLVVGWQAALVGIALVWVPVTQFAMGMSITDAIVDTPGGVSDAAPWIAAIDVLCLVTASWLLIGARPKR